MQCARSVCHDLVALFIVFASHQNVSHCRRIFTLALDVRHRTAITDCGLLRLEIGHRTGEFGKIFIQGSQIVIEDLVSGFLLCLKFCFLGLFICFFCRFFCRVTGGCFCRLC